ncbi:MAG: hypothetical protein Q8Q73_04635, partial [Stagnimonas sp.]|nr:hypothetical protein [Stagnimonas sp.]
TLTRLQTLVFGLVILALGAGALLRVELPSPPVQAGDWLQGGAARDFERHYDQAFPTRDFGTNLWAALEYRLFNEGRHDLVIGREGWLFSAEEFDTYPDAEAEVERHLALIDWVHQRLAARGVVLLVAPVPAKLRLYGEQLDPGGRRPAAIRARLYERLLDELDRQGIPAPNLLGSLERCRAQGEVFLRTDTHWTPRGADCAAQAMAMVARARRLARADAAGQYRTLIDNPAAAHEGDLFRFLPLAPHFESWLPAVEAYEQRRTERVGAGASAGLLDETAAPEIVLVGTSYSADRRWNFVGALQEAFGEDIVSYAVDGRGPFQPMLDYLDDPEARQQPPRLLIWEIPERYLPRPVDLRGQGLPTALGRPAPQPPSPRSPT